ncbi:MAG: peptidase S9, partial [Gemmatimonadales bacterium]
MRVVTLVIAMVLPPTLQAQYFGQNRVQYSTLNFDVIRTPHFEAHFPRGGDVAALDAVRMAERTYGRLSRTLNYQYVARQPLILFGSHSQFQQNNVVPIAEGTGGVTDAVRQRVLLPFTGSYAELEHVLAHELVHQFQYDIFARGQPGALDALIAINPPLWFMEGMAEYLSLDGPVPNTDMWLKDALLHGGLPTVHELTTDPTIFPYRYGHDLFRFIESRWGSGAVADVMHAVATYGVGPGLVRALGVGEDELSIGWSESVHARFPHLQDLVPQGTASLDHRATGARWHLSPALSPDGSKVVYLSEGNSLSIDLWVANIDATERRRLVRGAFSAEFESLRFISSGASWSPDGVNVAMAVKHGGRDDLVIVNTQSGAVVRRLPIPLDAVMNPTWSPDGSQIAFTGLMDGWSDLYSIGVSGGVPRRLTADRHADYHPSWSPDGRSIAFATDRTDQTNEENLDFGSLAVAVLDLTSGDVTLLPEMTDTNIDPEWSPTGDAIAFVSSRTGTANVFLYDVAKGTSRPITSVATGVS